MEIQYGPSRMGRGLSGKKKLSRFLSCLEVNPNAYRPELEGCHSQDDSLEEIIANIKETIELYLETLSVE